MRKTSCEKEGRKATFDAIFVQIDRELPDPTLLNRGDVLHPKLVENGTWPNPTINQHAIMVIKWLTMSSCCVARAKIVLSQKLGV